MGLYGVNKRKGAHQKTIDRCHLVVRLYRANSLLTDPEIAQLAGLRVGVLTRLKRLPQYKQIHNQYMTGILASVDLQTDENFADAKATLKTAVPIALQGLLQQALTAKDERVKNKAFNDILDREGTFAKTTRQDVSIKDQTTPVTSEDDEIAAELIAAKNNLGKVVTPGTNTIN